MNFSPFSHNANARQADWQLIGTMLDGLSVGVLKKAYEVILGRNVLRFALLG